VIREYARRALAGESLKEMANDLNARGIPSSTGRPWSDSDRLRALLTAPGRDRNPGRRSYLLSGIFACGRCGTPMVGRAHA
jgi:Recombinase